MPVRLVVVQIRQCTNIRRDIPGRPAVVTARRSQGTCARANPNGGGAYVEGDTSCIVIALFICSTYGLSDPLCWKQGNAHKRPFIPCPSLSLLSSQPRVCFRRLQDAKCFASRAVGKDVHKHDGKLPGLRDGSTLMASRRRRGFNPAHRSASLRSWHPPLRIRMRSDSSAQFHNLRLRKQPESGEAHRASFCNRIEQKIPPTAINAGITLPIHLASRRRFVT